MRSVLLPRHETNCPVGFTMEGKNYANVNFNSPLFPALSYCVIHYGQIVVLTIMMDTDTEFV